MKIIASTLCAKRREILHLEAARFLKIVVVRHDVRALLRIRRKSKCKEREPEKAWEQSPRFALRAASLTI
jgi:hypothetical protein